MALAKSQKILKDARQVLQIEERALRAQQQHLDAGFVQSVLALLKVIQNQKKVVVMGIGKSGLIGRKIAATLSSTGTPSVFFHPAEGMHGDLGLIQDGDVILALSASGQTEEIRRILPVLKQRQITLIALTCERSSRLAQTSDHVICSFVDKEACPLNLAPTASSTAMLALGDALAVAVMKERHFKAEDFARLHPGGQLGRRLTWKVKDAMRKGKNCPVVRLGTRVKQALIEMTRTQMGATLVVDKKGYLAGFFTDGDLRRHLQKNDALLNLPIDAVMTAKPKTLSPEQTLDQALDVLKKYGCDNVPVVDAKNRPLGILDERDILED